MAKPNNLSEALVEIEHLNKLLDSARKAREDAEKAEQEAHSDFIGVKYELEGLRNVLGQTKIALLEACGIAERIAASKAGDDRCPICGLPQYDYVHRPGGTCDGLLLRLEHLKKIGNL